MEGKANKLQISYIKRAERQDLNTVVDCLKFYAVVKENQEAVVFVSEDFSREVVTWKELLEKSSATAKALVKLGVKKDEVVAINMRSCPQWLYLTFGAMMAGARPVGIVFTYTDGSDLIAIMEKLQTCSLLVMDPGEDNANWDIIGPLIELQGNGQVRSSKMPYLRYLIAHEQGQNNYMSGVTHFSEFIKDVPGDTQLPTIREDDIAFLFQTSGSTGVPKLIPHTHKSLMLTKQLAGATDNLTQFCDRPFQWLGGFPLTVVTGWKRVTLSASCKILEDRLKFLIEVMKKEECAFFIVMPTMLHEFIRRQDELTFDWSVQVLSVSGQPLQKALAKCIGKMAPMMVVGYGATEFLFGSSAFFSNPGQFQENLCGAVSSIPGMELKIVDEEEEIVPVNTKGEIYVRSPAMFDGYYNDPVKSAAVKTPDGWYKTDDVGWMDENGMLYVEGRKSSMIVSGGMNVAPEILERILESHPNVGLAVIVPLPDEVYHQVLCACVLTSGGSAVSEQDLCTFFDEYTNDKPGMFTVLPKYYMFLDEFPELSTGKTDRKALANMAKTKFSHQ